MSTKTSFFSVFTYLPGAAFYLQASWVLHHRAEHTGGHWDDIAFISCEQGPFPANTGMYNIYSFKTK